MFNGYISRDTTSIWTSMFNGYISRDYSPIWTSMFNGYISKDTSPIWTSMFNGYISRDTSPIIGQRKWLCRAYLNKTCGTGQKQWNLRIWVRKICTIWILDSKVLSRHTLSETEKFIEFWHEEESLWKFLSDSYKIRQEKEKSAGRISEKLEMTSK